MILVNVSERTQNLTVEREGLSAAVSNYRSSPPIMRIAL